MNLKTTHYIQGALATVAGAGLAVAQYYPQYMTQGHLVAALAGVALANLGLLSDSAVSQPGSSTVATSTEVSTTPPVAS